MSLIQMSLIGPEVFLLVASCVVLLASLCPHVSLRMVHNGSKLAVLGAAFMCWQGLQQHAGVEIGFSGMWQVDVLGSILKIAMLLSVAAIFFYSHRFVEHTEHAPSEFYLLTLFATLGMMVLVSASHLLTMYLGLELMSLPIYALVAWTRDRSQATEAALKYFITGALASGMLLYGFSMLYGATGDLSLTGLAAAMPALLAAHNQLVLFGIVFIVVGIAFKLGAVPFHMWVPDVYEGAPTPVALLIASAPKIAVYGMLFRLLVQAMPAMAVHWQPLLTLIAIASIVVGNLIAVMQTHLKRLLAYSSIAHMGYLLLGVVAVTQQGFKAALFYVLTYALTSLLSFGGLLLLSKDEKTDDSFVGLTALNQRHPWLAFMLLLGMFSMAGVPPLVGFMAKLGVLTALVHSRGVLLAIIALLFAVVGVFYYIRVVKVMYFAEPQRGEKSRLLNAKGASTAQWVLLSLNGLALLALGLFPGVLMSMLG